VPAGDDRGSRRRPQGTHRAHRTATREGPPSRGPICCATGKTPRHARRPVLAVGDGALGFWGARLARGVPGHL